MTQFDRLKKAAELYVEANRTLKTLDKEKEPDKYDKCVDIIGICGMILRKNGVEVTL